MFIAVTNTVRKKLGRLLCHVAERTFTKRKDGRWRVAYSWPNTCRQGGIWDVYAKSYAACREKRRRMEDALPQKPMLTGEMSVSGSRILLSEIAAAQLKASERLGAYEYMIRHYIVFPEIERS